jgi:hypothetical protein
MELVNVTFDMLEKMEVRSQGAKPTIRVSRNAKQHAGKLTSWLSDRYNIALAV